MAQKKSKKSAGKALKEAVLSAEMIRYIIVGVSGGVILNLGLYYILANFVFAKSAVPFFSDNAHAISSAIGWIAATVVTFLGNKYYVFKSSKEKKSSFFKEFLEFVGAKGFSFLVTTVGMKVFVDMNILAITTLVTDSSGEFVNAGGAALSFLFRVIFGIFETVFNYIMNKFVIFKKSDDALQEESSYGN